MPSATLKQSTCSVMLKIKTYLFLATLFVSCGPSKQAQLNAKMEEDYKVATTVNIERLYQQFIVNYPTSTLIPEIKIRLQELEEQNAFNDAIEHASIEAIDNFLAAYPNSKHKYRALNKRSEIAARVKAEMESKKLEESAWEKAQSIGTEEALQFFTLRYPNSSYLDAAKQQIEKIRKQKASADQAEKQKRAEEEKRQLEKLKLEDDTMWQQAKKQNTTAAFKKYLNAYPNGQHSEEAAAQIIVKEVDAIQNAPHGKLSAPQIKSESSKYSTNCDIEITNGTPYQLTVWYDGPSKKKIVLNPDESFDLQILPGHYRVAAKVKSTSVRPFAGSYTLHLGAFTEHFYIKTTIR